jgi:protein maelstrom
MTQETVEKVRALERRNSLQTHPFQPGARQLLLQAWQWQVPGVQIALVEFSFVDGVRKIYPVGYTLLATKRATETHLIPLPPDGFGSEFGRLEILKNIGLFLMGEDGDETKLSPMYTRPGDIDAVESDLRQLHERPGPYTNAGRDMFRVYFVFKLFHELRNASMCIPSAVISPPKFLAEHELVNDALEFTEGLSCDFHDKADAMRHCSLAHVQRWSF